MEDFGYQKDSQSKFLEIGKKAFLVGATIFSIACFIYITINAYYFVYQDPDAEIEMISATEGPIKVLAENNNKKKDGATMQINRSIYEDIFGNKKASEKTKVLKVLKPAIPPKKEVKKSTQSNDNVKATSDRRLIKKPVSQGRNQRIVVFSDSKDSNKSAADLLTKTDGKRTTQPIKQSTKTGKRSVRVQVAAMSSKKAAQAGWDRLARMYPKLLSDLEPEIEEVNLGKRGLFYRLQIGSFYNQLEAEEFCGRYVAQSQKSRADCIIVE